MKKGNEEEMKKTRKKEKWKTENGIKKKNSLISKLWIQKEKQKRENVQIRKKDVEKWMKEKMKEICELNKAREKRKMYRNK